MQRPFSVDPAAALVAESLEPFDFSPQTRVVFGPGAIDRLGDLAKGLGAKRVLLVSDPGVEEAGHEERGAESLRAAGLHVTLFSDVQPNPTTADVERGLRVAREAGIDFIVGIGGGSSMDCAKGINFVLTNGGTMRDYHGSGKATKPMLPSIGVPTTAGTGSEAQSYALIADAETHMKMACGDKKAAFRIAILDPDLTLSMPLPVTAATGIDAISHAVESYVTTARNEVSQLFARRAWKLLAEGFPRVIDDPGDRDARAAMLVGAHFAGIAIENSMLGATHALVNPLSAHFDLTHGVAIGIMLPHVIRYNEDAAATLYAQLAADIGLCDADDPAATGLLADQIEGLVAAAGLPTTLADCEVTVDAFDVMAKEAAEQWTGRFNPRPVDAARLKELYRCALTRRA